MSYDLYVNSNYIEMYLKCFWIYLYKFLINLSHFLLKYSKFKCKLLDIFIYYLYVFLELMSYDQYFTSICLKMLFKLFWTWLCTFLINLISILIVILSKFRHKLLNIYLFVVYIYIFRTKLKSYDLCIFQIIFECI